MKNKYKIPVVTSLSQYFNLPRFIWLKSTGTKRSRWENRGNGNFIQFGIRIKKYVKYH